MKPGEAKRRGRRTIRATMLAAALALGGAASASAATAAFIMDGLDAPRDDVRIARPGEPLWVQPLHPDMTVELSDAVEMPLRSLLGFSTTGHLEPGTRLYSVTTDRRTFCAPYHDSKVSSSFACLRDTDGDGVFDTGRTATPANIKLDFICIKDDGRLSGASWIGDAAPLAVKARYAPVTGARRLEVPLALSWKYHPAKKANPARLDVWAAGGPDKFGGGPGAGRMDVTQITGIGDTITYYGAAFTVLEVLPDGSLRYRLHNGFTPARVSLQLQDGPQVMFITIMV